MSSMVSRAFIIASLLGSTAAATPVSGQTSILPEDSPAESSPVENPADSFSASDWDRARLELMRTGRGSVAASIARWDTLTSSDRFAFDDYASFILQNPGWPFEDRLRGYAEKSLQEAQYSPTRIAAFFERYPALTAGGQARYALALQSLGRTGQAREAAIDAWRRGSMDDADELQILGLYSPSLTPADHDARMDSLLWQGNVDAAERHLALTSSGARTRFAARLAMVRGDSSGAGLADTLGADALTHAGYVYNRARALRRSGQGYAAQSMLASRPALATYPVDVEEWYEELLANARDAAGRGNNSLAFQIARRVDDAFPAETNILDLSAGVRDDYTSLVWLAGTQAMWELNRPADAVQMFYRYGQALTQPEYRPKGYYWAGRAALAAGQGQEATRFFELAAKDADHFYGQLALERLGRALPDFTAGPQTLPSEAEESVFASETLSQAVREISRNGDWSKQIRFYRAISDKAMTEGQHLLVANLAREIGRRDLAVILSKSARAKGLNGFQRIGFPELIVPSGYENNWTMIHAITRQESQFAPNAVSHAGARGLMQLMPGTAREQSGKIALGYSLGALTDDPSYNIKLGSSYFSRMLDYYGGAFPLAVAAYNAGPGNVNKWLRANGDPRTGSVDWIRWIEEIPFWETKNYVQRVLENAVVYDALDPERANYRGQNPISHYIGKSTPG